LLFFICDLSAYEVAMTGSLSVTVGCMFAGKSTHAVNAVRRWRCLGKNVMVITPAIDTRYGEDGIHTHDLPGVQIECESSATLTPLQSKSEYEHADVVVIEEAQFFPDLYPFCLSASERDGKNVLVYGLDGTARREQFGALCALCPIADHFVKIPALCRMCSDGTEAGFTVAFEPIPHSGIKIGGAKVYAAVCRKHYMSHTDDYTSHTDNY
jgi:thymidine kinase